MTNFWRALAVVLPLCVVSAGAENPEVRPELPSRGDVVDAVWGRVEGAVNEVASMQYQLAWDYVEGFGGLDVSEAKAFYWFKQAAENGFVDAYYYLGWAYRSGLGVEADVERALEWFRKSADAGYLASMTIVGEIYATGELGAVDFTTASDWFHRATVDFDVLAANNIAWYFATVEAPRHVKGKRAVELMAQVVRADPHHNHYDTLAAAFAASGQFANAQRAQEHAIRLADSVGDLDLIQSYTARLVLYERGERFVYYGYDGPTE